MKNKYLLLIIIIISLTALLIIQKTFVKNTLFGGIIWNGTTSSNTAISTSTATAVLDNNPARRKAIITKCINENDVYLRFEAATTTYSTTTASSLTLNSSTTNYYIIEPDNNGDIWSGVVTAWSDLNASSSCLINTFEY